jgi:4-hydroxybenzoate polyprenyltransferase
MTLRPYLELLRPPNLATAGADILAGYAVAGAGVSKELPWLLLATICLYGGGVTLNDFFDRDLDSIERPERPIPSGRVRPAAAAILGAALLFAGIVTAGLATPVSAVVAGAIAALVILYNGWAKRHMVLGPMNMGLCRALNLVLGISAIPAALSGSWQLALLPFVYICGVTALSRGEVHGGSSRTALFSFVCVLSVLAGALLLTLSPGHRSVGGWALALILGWRVLPPIWRAYGDSQPVLIRNAVKTGVLSLVLLDAVTAAAYAGTYYGLLLLTSAVLAGRLARFFAVT